VSHELLNHCFSSDTGMLILIAKDILMDFIQKYSLDELLNSSDVYNKEYWNNLISKYEISSIGLIFSPGYKSGYEFEGSGSYIII
jgi:hypothetical protein